MQDVEETNGRWLEREPGIWERADWDLKKRVLTLAVRGASGETAMQLSWRSPDEWRRSSNARASRSRRRTAGST